MSNDDVITRHPLPPVVAIAEVLAAEEVDAATPPDVAAGTDGGVTLFPDVEGAELVLTLVIPDWGLKVDAIAIETGRDGCDGGC